MSSYHVQQVKKDLIYISWSGTPSYNEAKQFVEMLHKLLDDADSLIYFISDLRKGSITDVRVINQMGRLAEHENWGGSTAFTSNPVSKIFAGNFHKNKSVQQDNNNMFPTPEEAIAFLASLSPQLVENIDWEAVIEQGQSTG